jgi:hypothetical protein
MMKSPRELAAQRELIGDEITKLMTEGRTDEAIRRHPEHEPEIRSVEAFQKSKEQTDHTSFEKAFGYRSLKEMAASANEANACHREALMLSRIGDFPGAEKAFDRAIQLAELCDCLHEPGDSVCPHEPNGSSHARF